MKNTARNLLFFKAIFNGRVDDNAMASAAGALGKHSATPTKVSYPTVLEGSAFVFPYGSSCHGTIKDEGTSVSVEGKWKKVLTSSSAAVGGSKKLSFFHMGTLYSVPATVEVASSSPSVTFTAATNAEAVTAAPTMEMVAAEAAKHFASTVSAALYDLAITASRHSTAVAEYDQYLCHNENVQKHLVTIETYRYALEALAGTVSADDSALLLVFARLALSNSVSVANAILGSHVVQHGEKVTAAPRPHPSSPATLSIDYTAFTRAKALLAELNVSGGATDADVGTYALGDLFAKDSTSVKPVGKFTKNPLHLSPTHSTTARQVTALQDELAGFPTNVTKIVDPKNKMQVKKAAEIAAELLASVAVVHRCSAALSSDVEGEGRVQSSIVPIFCNLSEGRRADALRTIQSLKTAGKNKTVDLDDVSVHPSQFEN